MEKIKLLLIEDDEGDIGLCRDVTKEIEKEQNIQIELHVSKTIEDGMKNINNSYDGTIIDIILNTDNIGGAKIVESIKNCKMRIPIAMYTGTPDFKFMDDPRIKIFIKGKDSYEGVIKYLIGIYKTGITRIMGGRGKIEETLYDVYDKILFPDLNIWQLYAEKAPELTEKALLRFTLNHLWQLLDDDNEKYFPEEVYIKPPNIKPTTGSIIKEKNNAVYFILLSPSCDLVEREGKVKTEKLIMAEIEPYRDVLKIDKNQKSLEKKMKNNEWFYRHWIPETNDFSGGFINFRKLTATAREKFDAMFEWHPLQIAAPFIRNIQSRFASYYARQGEPEINLDFLIERLLKQQQ